MFFSEEKNQKTFMSLQLQRCRPWPARWKPRRNKSLLLLFFRKEDLSHCFAARLTLRSASTKRSMESSASPAMLIRPDWAM